MRASPIPAAPWHHAAHGARLIGVPRKPQGVTVAQVRPVLRLGREEAALVSDGRTLGRQEARLTGEVGQFPERHAMPALPCENPVNGLSTGNRESQAIPRSMVRARESK